MTIAEELRSEGMQQGALKEANQIAHKMIIAGFDIATISKLTSLMKDELLKMIDEKKET